MERHQVRQLLILLPPRCDHPQQLDLPRSRMVAVRWEILQHLQRQGYIAACVHVKQRVKAAQLRCSPV